ncbi:DUF3951 domain-containing protein [Cytobacillus dafuensis]|uniref:DUF3951 domain-containing protein n=1 Tax=Cytobacillus dafuensis TaxID=1742359 RepID=UPI00070EE74B|nr:DUF3951 domain-containing protein [Cytobacillus dafuensis]
MAYFYTLFVISVIGFVIFRMIRKKSAPTNRYTPYDDITLGNKIYLKQDTPIQDSKHLIQYEEKVKNDKTV